MREHKWIESRRGASEESVEWSANDSGLWMDGALLGFPEAAREILRLEDKNDALTMTVEEGGEIEAELSTALAVACAEKLTPCAAGCPGHLGPKAQEVFTEALNRWRAMEDELRLLREWEAAYILRYVADDDDAIRAHRKAWASLVAYREKQSTNKEENG